MPRKQPPKTPGAMPAPKSAKATKPAAAPKVDDGNDVIEAEANPIPAEQAGSIDATKLKKAVFIEGQGWLCPQPKLKEA